MFPQPRINAQATVDPGAFEVADRINEQPFVVHVTGFLDGGDPLPNRDYEITADCESRAAWEGIGRYVHEMERLN